MYQGQIRTAVAAVILGGHLMVFMAGLALGLFGPLQGTDFVQTVLMASPVLAVTATAAMLFILNGELNIKAGERVTKPFAIMVLAFPTLLILCIFALFAALFFQVDGYGPNQMKVALGGVETFFGVFIGLISDRLFGRLPKSAARRRAT